MAFWKKWTQEIWIGSKEEEEDDQDVGPAVHSAQQTKKKKKKPKQPKPEVVESSKSILRHLQNFAQQTTNKQIIHLFFTTKLEPTWKDYLLLDRRLRVAYVIILIVIVGLILPMVLSYYLGEYRADLGNCDTPTLNR